MFLVDMTFLSLLGSLWAGQLYATIRRREARWVFVGGEQGRTASHPSHAVRVRPAVLPRPHF